VGVRLKDLDREEILRTRATAIEQRRVSAGTSMDVGDILDRLGLRVDGEVTQAAQTLYGRSFRPIHRLPPRADVSLAPHVGCYRTGALGTLEQLRPRPVPPC
jgi:hypothetical protein